MTVFLLFVSTIIAFWASAICGGGASLILIPVLNLLLPPAIVPFSLTIGTLTSSASRIVVFRRRIKWHVFIWFVPFSIPAVLAGAYLIKFINPNYLQLLVALLLVSNAPELIGTGRRESGRSGSISRSGLAVIGFAAGFVSGVTGAIGLLFNRFYFKIGLTKEEIVATRAANEICLHLIKLIIYVLLGLYSSTGITLGLVIAVATIVSSYSVRFILPYLSEQLFQKIGYAAMVISGLFLLSGTLGKIVQHDEIAFGTLYTGGEKSAMIKWRDTRIALEYAVDDGLEIERTIGPEELPLPLQNRYQHLKRHYDNLYLERVYAFGKKPVFEFYAYKGSRLTKMEF